MLCRGLPALCGLMATEIPARAADEAALRAKLPTTEALPVQAGLPDVLMMLDGTRGPSAGVLLTSLATFASQLLVQRGLILAIAVVIATAVTAHSAELFPTGATWKYLRGSAEASAPDVGVWRENAFADSNWSSGPAPFFYGETTAGTELSDMRSQYSCVFLRRTFTIQNPGEVAKLLLRARADDGFVAWIDGREVARYNVPAGHLPFDATASAALPEPVPFETHVIDDPRPFLVAGENILAVQAFNSSLSDSNDFFFDASLDAVLDETPPTVTELIPPAGSTVRELASVEVRFSEPVLGVEAADLLINNSPAAEMIKVASGEFLFTFPAPPDGVVSVAWRVEHGITDRAGVAHPFAGGSWTVTLDTRSPAPGLMISEFMADNRRTLNDEDGESSDWVEIFNSGETPASLLGWFLTDDRLNLAKWTFPDVTIEPKSFLVVFASEKNKSTVPGRLHTNFKLTDAGEYLALVAPNTNVVSEFAPDYPKQFRDVSYGRVPGAPGSHGYFTQPTPGAANSHSGPGFGPVVEFSRASGTITEPFELRLSTSLSGALIRYTLDGTLPTNSSTAYLGPIAVTNSVQVRARSYADNLLPGPPHSEAYLRLDGSLETFTSDLPVVVLHTLGSGSPNASRQTSANLSVYEPDRGVTSLARPPTLITRAALKLRGSSTQDLAKSSFAVEFWDEFNADVDLEILGMPADSDWVLYAVTQYEPAMIHNPFVHQLARDLGAYSSRTRFVEVFLNTGTGPISTNHYNGIYVLEEKIKIAPDRIAIDGLEAEHVQPPEVTGGYVFKMDRLDPGDGGFKAGGQTFAYVDPKEREIKLPQRDPQEQYLKKFLNDFNQALNSPDWLDPKLGYRPYIDTGAWIDFHLIESLTGSVDAFTLSTYFYKPRNGKLVSGPHWDYDRAFAGPGAGASRSWLTATFTGWNARLFRDKDFWQLWIDRFQQLRLSHLSLTNVFRLIDGFAGEVRQAQPRETARWRVALRGGTYQNEVNLMRNWLSNHLDYLDKQFTPPPSLSASGGRISAGFALELAVPNKASAYYTLDGSDPRLPQGEISPQAKTYTGPITLTGNARVVARSHNAAQRQPGGPPVSSPWSGPVAATFVVAPPPLIITEIMFHPVVSPGSTNRASDFEFIELKNVGTETLGLIGFHFGDGIQFRFEPTHSITSLAAGARLVLVKNLAAFAARYPRVNNVAGEYAGSLRESGERLSLLGPLEEPVVDFSFSDDWQTLSDGFGFSLVLADEPASPDKLGLRESWRLSAALGGSPGQADPPRSLIAPVLVNEALTHTDPPAVDAVELFNPSQEAADVSGWFLTDDFRAPRKFQLPQNTRIDPGGFLLVDEFQLRHSDASGFALSSQGDAVYLFSADAAGNLTGWVHGFQFGASANGVSFGRHVDSVGREHFVADAKVTLKAANSGPLVDAVVIHEIHYQPLPLDPYDSATDEFIELLNRSTLPAPLFDPAHPENAWRLRGGVEFDLPPRLTLPPQGALVIVSFDPRTDPGALQSFRARFGMDADTPMVGPWRGRLNNAGDRVRLYRPDEPQLPPSPDAGLVPYVLVEEVNYSPAAPWPSDAAGTGRSLQRRAPHLFGDDPKNWMAAIPSPGDLDSDGDGLPDRWELRHSLSPAASTGADGPDGNPDGDGFSNAQEFAAGTDPSNPSSVLALTADLTAGGLRLHFNAVPERTYRVLYSENLSSGQWRTLRVFPAALIAGVIEHTDTTPGATRFYRLQTP